LAAHFPSYLKAGTMSDTKFYNVLSNLRHNGATYKADDPDHCKIELTPEEAKPLLKLKVIGEPDSEQIEQFSKNVANAAVNLVGALNQGSGAAPKDTSEDPKTDGADAASKTAPLSQEERLAAIRNVLPQLKADEDLTKAGEPKVRSIEQLVGFDVSAEEVKTVWADVQAANKAAKGE